MAALEAAGSPSVPVASPSPGPSPELTETVARLEALAAKLAGLDSFREQLARLEQANAEAEKLNAQAEQLIETLTRVDQQVSDRLASLDRASAPGRAVPVQRISATPVRRRDERAKEASNLAGAASITGSPAPALLEPAAGPSGSAEGGFWARLSGGMSQNVATAGAEDAR
jgi:hypothetical protein